MKRIAIFCDGTWNLTEQLEAQTNVVQLAQAVRLEADNGIKQIPIYVRGVGTGIGSTRLARWTDKVFGGALGWGLGRNVLDAYKALIWVYEPGDEIYIFGFSRGAHTARSLGGLLRKSGILPRDRIDLAEEAMELYRTRGEKNKPDTSHIQARRAELSPDVATSQDDARKRDKRVVELRIAYMGVWDTVRAMGVPEFLGPFARWINRKYAFHDGDLSSSVKAARHAMALDERRKHYPPTPWTNLPTVTETTRKRAKEEGEEMPDPEPYRQLWFVGDHGSIGGGGTVKGLSAITLGWVAEGGSNQGLEFDPERLSMIEALCNVGEPVNNREKPGWLKALTKPVLGDREGPDSPEQVHPSVIDRIRLGSAAHGGAYKPGSLDRVWDDLPGLLPKKAGD